METLYMIILAVIIFLGVTVLFLGIYSSAVQGFRVTNQFQQELPKLMKALKAKELELDKYKYWQTIQPWPREYLYTEIDRKTKASFEHAQEELQASLYSQDQFVLHPVTLDTPSWGGLLRLGSNLETITRHKKNQSTMQTLRGHLQKVESELNYLHTLRADIQRINQQIVDDLSKLERQSKNFSSDLDGKQEAGNEFTPLQHIQTCLGSARKALEKPKTIDDIQFAQAKIWLLTGQHCLNLATVFYKKVSVPRRYKMDYLGPQLQRILSVLEASIKGSLPGEFGLLYSKSQELDSIGHQITDAERSLDDFLVKSKALDAKIEAVKNLAILEKIKQAQEAEQGLQSYWRTIDECPDKWKDFLQSDKLPSRRLQSKRNQIQMLEPQLETIFESKVLEIQGQLERILSDVEALMDQVKKVHDQTREEERAEEVVKAELGEKGGAKQAIDDLNRIHGKCKPEIAKRIEKVNSRYISIHQEAQVRATADYPSLERKLIKLKETAAKLLEEHRLSMQEILAEAARLDTTMVQLEMELASIEKRLPSSSVTYPELSTVIRNAKSAYTQAKSTGDYGKFSTYIQDTETCINQVLVQDIADVKAEILRQQEDAQGLVRKVQEVENLMNTRVRGVGETWRKPLSRPLADIDELRMKCQRYRERCAQLEQYTLKEAGEEIARIDDELVRIRRLSNEAISRLQDHESTLISMETKIEGLLDDIKDSQPGSPSRSLFIETRNKLQEARNEENLDAAIDLLQETLGRLQARPTYYDNRKIKVGDINKSSATIFIGDKNTVKTGLSDEAVVRLFSELRLTANRISDINARIEAQKAIRQLEAEAQKGDEASESKVEKWLDFLFVIAQDVWEVAVATFSNPISGLSLVFRKVAERAKSKKRRN